MINTLARVVYSVAAFAFVLLIANPAYAIYDPEAQKNCAPNAAETVCIMRGEVVDKEALLPLVAITSVTEAIIKSPLALAQKVEMLKTLVNSLGKFLESKIETDKEDEDVVYSYQNGEVVFQNGKYSFNLGCNTIFGTYTRKGSEITISPGASTKKACERDLMKRDEQLIKDLAKVTKIEEVDGNLVLSGKEVELKLVNKVTYSYNGGTATFANGQYSFKVGCNTIFGTYEQDGEEVTLSAGASTLMACEADLMKKDGQLVKDLAKVTTMKKDGQNLILSGGGVTLKLVEKPVK